MLSISPGSDRFSLKLSSFDNEKDKWEVACDERNFGHNGVSATCTLPLMTNNFHSDNSDFTIFSIELAMLFLVSAFISSTTTGSHFLLQLNKVDRSLEALFHEPQSKVCPFASALGTRTTPQLEAFASTTVATSFSVQSDAWVPPVLYNKATAAVLSRDRAAPFLSSQNLAFLSRSVLK